MGAVLLVHTLHISKETALIFQNTNKMEKQTDALRDIWTNKDYVDQCWYEAELARTGRASCREFRCGKLLAAGQLRLGISINAYDEGRTEWFCPPCLFKTCCYKKNANKRISDISDMRGQENLEERERKALQRLINDAQPQATPVARSKRKIGSEGAQEDTANGSAKKPASDSCQPFLKIITNDDPEWNPVTEVIRRSVSAS